MSIPNQEACVESGHVANHNKAQNINAAQGGGNGSTEHVFSGGAAETENINRLPVVIDAHLEDTVAESRELVEQTDTTLPVAGCSPSEEEKVLKRAKRRAHYAANREKICAQRRVQAAADRSKRSVYAASYRRRPSAKAYMRPYLKEWEARHKSWRREYNRKYYIAHREKMIADAMEYKRRKREGN